MIKDILVQLPTEKQVRPVVDGAVSLAAAYGAHVDAVAVGYVSESTAYVMEGGAALATVFELERDRAMARAETALSVFETEAKSAGISYACHAKGAFPAEASASLGAAARLYDLAVVLQPRDRSADLRQQASPGNFVSCRRPRVVHAVYIPGRLQGEAHWPMLGWQPPRRAGAAGCHAFPDPGRHPDHHYDQ